MKDLRILVRSLALAAVLSSCSTADENFTGSEYMPDMAHSLAMEANTYNYYYYNTWDDRSTIELSKLVYPRVTVEGTVPRGFAGKYVNDAQIATGENELRSYTLAEQTATGISAPTNGHVPYYFEDSPEGRLAALAELNDNPFPITEEGMIRGAKLYNIFCGICHGAQGNGLGYIYDDEQNPNAAYPLAPANFLTDEFKAANNGRYYHAIMYGYNAMGAYKDKISYEERWQVIHYIRSLQAKDSEKIYAEDQNTLNPSFGVPMAEYLPGGMPATDNNEEMGAAGEQTAVDGTPTQGNQLRKK